MNTINECIAAIKKLIELAPQIAIDHSSCDTPVLLSEGVKAISNLRTSYLRADQVALLKDLEKNLRKFIYTAEGELSQMAMHVFENEGYELVRVNWTDRNFSKTGVKTPRFTIIVY